MYICIIIDYPILIFKFYNIKAFLLSRWTNPKNPMTMAVPKASKPSISPNTNPIPKSTIISDLAHAKRSSAKRCTVSAITMGFDVLRPVDALTAIIPKILNFRKNGIRYTEKK